MLKFDITALVAALAALLITALIVAGILFGGSLLVSLEQQEVGKTSYESKLRTATLEACAAAQTPIEFGEGFYLAQPGRTKIHVWGIPSVVEMGYENEKLVSCELRD